MKSLSGIRLLAIMFAIISATFLFPSTIHKSQSDETTHQSKIYDHKQVTCLAKNMFYEAGNQSDKGKLAVAAVTMNRTQAVGFPTTICEVVYQKVAGKCQFSWTCSKQPMIKKEDFDKAYLLARDFYHKSIDSPIKDDVLYYHAAYLKNNEVRWFKKSLLKVVQIGDHIFYRGKV